ncbi:MAG: AmmeMemoRadiSam system protein B [Aquificaceae bacterium]|nr:AmmeMemoRadiSam system protein B [Aquificaceae bacterium]MDW8422864.1 AmmeMemoRadiSam system protein B [Aquificaceae bacterium]
MKVRKPRVVGYFYPSDRKRLADYVDRLTENRLDLGECVRGIIAPHAGYECSGPTAGVVYSTLRNKSYKRVVLVGPSHFVDFDGFSFGSFDAFETPLGVVTVDKEAIQGFAENHRMMMDEPHIYEHSLEVQLPFLQRILGDFLLVPVVYGKVEGYRLKLVLEHFCDENTLFVISSDLSHYYEDSQARVLDSHCHAWILKREEESKQKCEACGKSGIEAAILYSREKGLKAHLLDYKTSAETCSDRHRVVGYGGYAFTS